MQSLSKLRWLVTGSFCVTAGLGLWLAIPLWLGQVAPNGVTGFRTAATLADPALWYRVNCATGRTMAIVNAALLVGTVALHFSWTRTRPAAVALGLAGAFVTGMVAVALQGAYLIHAAH